MGMTVIIGVIALLVALPGCINNGLALKDRWRGKPMVDQTSSRQTAPRSLFIFNIIGAALLLWVAYQMWVGPSQKSGFYKGWPDAIRCKWTAPNEGSPSEYIFLYRGHANRDGLGNVEAYFLLGSPPPPATFHELLLRDDDGSVIAPEEIPDNSQYKASYLPGKPDCGGKTVEEMKKAGRAYSFARPMK
jgi:hypothetical protein